MFRFLTDEVRSKLAEEYALRRAAVALALLATLLLFAIIALSPSLIIAESRRSAALEELASAEEFGNSGERGALEVWAEGIRSDLRYLSPEGRGAGPHEYFNKVLKEKPAGVKITGLSLAESSGSKLLKINGVAKDRQALLLFENELRNSGEWQSTNFPVGNLAKDADISFELTLVPNE